MSNQHNKANETQSDLDDMKVSEFADSDDEIEQEWDGAELKSHDDEIIRLIDSSHHRLYKQVEDMERWNQLRKCKNCSFMRVPEQIECFCVIALSDSGMKDENENAPNNACIQSPLRNVISISVTANKRRAFDLVNGFSSRLLSYTDVVGMVLSFCGPCFVLAANKEHFVKAVVLARSSGDNVEAMVSLTTQHDAKYLLNVSDHSVGFGRMDNDECIAQDKYAEIEIGKNQNANLKLNPRAVEVLIDEHADKGSDSVNLVFDVASKLLGVSKFGSSDGFKWFLWTQILGKQSSKNM